MSETVWKEQALNLMALLDQEKRNATEILMALKELLEAYSKPDERLCCDGRDCGCMGSTVHQQAEHFARAAIDKAETSSVSRA